MDARLRVRGWLRAQTPVHVGGAGGGPDSQLNIAVDGLDRPYVPGTSLAGVLKAWTRGAESADTDEMRQLWGFITPNTTDGTASRLVVHDALITDDTELDRDGEPAAGIDPVSLELRHGVGIDRHYGVGAPGILYTRQVVPAAAYLRFALDLESTTARFEQDCAQLAAILSALTVADVALGAATSRGLGVVRLLDDPLDIVEDRFDSPAGLLAVLRGCSSRNRSLAELSTTGTVAVLPPRRQRLHICVDWEPAAPVLVRSGRDGVLVDTLPLTTRVDRNQLTLVLPGSTIKGILRTRAELIERTARELDAPFAGPDEALASHADMFRAQLDQLPVVCALFGAARGTDTHDQPGGAGALTAAECAANLRITEDLWAQMFAPPEITNSAAATTPAEPEPPKAGPMPDDLRHALDRLGLSRADHVAIDRFTGGAADGRLFSVLEPHHVSWAPMTLTVDLGRLGQRRDLGLALLLLVLRDLYDGWVPLGAATNRGCGDIHVTNVTLTGAGWDGANLVDVLAGANALTAAWQGYCEGKAL